MRIAPGPPGRALTPGIARPGGTASTADGTAEGRSYGVTGTPTFFINGKKFVGAQPYAKFQAEIDAALAG